MGRAENPGNRRSWAFFWGTLSNTPIQYPLPLRPVCDLLSIVIPSPSHPDSAAVALLADALSTGAPSPDSWDFPLVLDVFSAVAPAHPAIPPALLRLLSSPDALPAPVALQILHRALAALPPDVSAALLANALPLLPDLLEAETDRFDPDTNGRARWPSASSPLFPAPDALPDAPALDAAILLANEARLYLRLAARTPALQDAIPIARASLHDTESLLGDDLWLPDEQTFGVLLTPSLLAPDTSACPLLAFLWITADAAILDALRPRVPELLSLPIPEPAFLYLGRALLDSPHRRAFSAWTRVAADRPPPSAPLHAAARSLLLGEAACRRVRHLGPHLARSAAFLSRHPFFSSLLLAAPLLLLAAVGTTLTLLRSSPPSPLPPLRTAAALSADSRHAEAAETLLLAAAATPDETHLLRFRAANALLLADRPAQAEPLYRDLLSLYPSHPSLLLNLAASLVRQNRPAEAIPLYQSVLDLPPARATPSATARATAALDLLRRREASRKP